MDLEEKNLIYLSISTSIVSIVETLNDLTIEIPVEEKQMLEYCLDRYQELLEKYTPDHTKEDPIPRPIF